jgi:quercetin dioxygenase-like cupin family protein
MPAFHCDPSRPVHRVDIEPGLHPRIDFRDQSLIKLRTWPAKVIAAVVVMAFAAACAQAQTSSGLKITRNGAQPATRGPVENFTGSVRVDTQFLADAPARVSGGLVTFDPGAYSAWHTHPVGQTLIVTQGVGLVQRWDGPVQEIRPGDVVWIPPGEKHWHGATPSSGMSHFAISEQLAGKGVEWLEKVTDAQYRSRP